jgi:poly(A) polymerase
MAPGPAIGALLKTIEAWWLDHDMQPDRDACLAELQRTLAENRA